MQRHLEYVMRTFELTSLKVSTFCLVYLPHSLKRGDQLSKIGNQGGIKLLCLKRGGQIKKGGLVYTSWGFCIFTCILQIKSLNWAIIQYITDLDYLMYYFRNVCPVSYFHFVFIISSLFCSFLFIFLFPHFCIILKFHFIFSCLNYIF